METAPDGESFLNLIRGQQKPQPARPALVVSSIRGDLGLKTTDGWKFIDGSGGGNGTSWDSSNVSIPGAAGTDRGVPKQLFHLALDLGEDSNLIADLTNTSSIRSELEDVAGSDLLGTLDALRATQTTALYKRSPDNDGDGLPNAYELSFGLEPDFPTDASEDADGDSFSNLAEFLAGTSPTDETDFFSIREFTTGSDSALITWSSVTGRDYDVTWSTDLEVWSVYSSHLGTGASITAELDWSTLGEDELGNLEKVFVRVEVVAP